MRNGTTLPMHFTNRNGVPVRSGPFRALPTLSSFNHLADLWTYSYTTGSFIHSGHFYSAPSSPLLLRGAPDYSTDTVSEFHAEAHRQLHVKDLPNRVHRMPMGKKFLSNQLIRATESCLFIWVLKI